jgi:hypothetical protein
MTGGHEVIAPADGEMMRIARAPRGQAGRERDAPSSNASGGGPGDMD